MTASPRQRSERAQLDPFDALSGDVPPRDQRDLMAHPFFSLSKSRRVAPIGERCEGDRHHFRFIVSPEDAAEMADLKAFTGELMSQMEKDLGTKLDWVAIDHWNTDNPHVHVLLRGRADDGQDLVISRDYIKEGMRARAQDLVTMELGPRSDHEIHRNLARQVEAERWTNLDRQLLRDAHKSGIIDLAPPGDHQPDEYHTPKVGRLRVLESLGLAHQIGAGQWYITEEAEPTLRELGEPAQAAARAQSGKRYDAFVAALGRRLAQGPKLRSEIPEDVHSADDSAPGDQR